MTTLRSLALIVLLGLAAAGCATPVYRNELGAACETALANPPAHADIPLHRLPVGAFTEDRAGYEYCLKRREWVRRVPVFYPSYAPGPAPTITTCIPNLRGGVGCYTH